MHGPHPRVKGGQEGEALTDPLTPLGTACQRAEPLLRQANCVQSLGCSWCSFAEKQRRLVCLGDELQPGSPSAKDDAPAKDNKAATFNGSRAALGFMIRVMTETRKAFHT